MPDFRALGQPSAGNAPSITLDREESHHLVAVNRAQSGQTVVVFDGHGHEWICRLRHASKTGAELEILETRVATALPFQIALAQALPKGPTMESIVRKATEIGATDLLPLSTERTQVHLEGDREDKKREKWQTAAVEAAKQCGNPWVPHVSAPVALNVFLTQLEPYDLRVVASLHPGTTTVDRVLADFQSTQGRLPRHAVCAIGPEGDFSPSEIQSLVNAGFRPITLGPLVLRCETAATYALAVLSHEWQKALASRT